MKFTDCYKVLEAKKAEFVALKGKGDASCNTLLEAAEGVINAARYLDEYGEKELEKGHSVSFTSFGIFKSELGTKLAELWAKLAILKTASEPDESKSTFSSLSTKAKEFLYDCVLPFFEVIAESEKSLLEEKFDFQQGKLTVMQKQRRNAGNRAEFLADQQKLAIRARAGTGASLATTATDFDVDVEEADSASIASCSPGRMG